MNHCIVLLLTFVLTPSIAIEDDPSTRKYPQILTDIPFIEDASAMDFEELLNYAAAHPGLEWIKDEELLAQYGINVTNIHPDIIADAFSTTVRIFWIHFVIHVSVFKKKKLKFYVHAYSAN